MLKLGSGRAETITAPITLPCLQRARRWLYKFFVILIKRVSWKLHAHLGRVITPETFSLIILKNHNSSLWKFILITLHVLIVQ